MPPIALGRPFENCLSETPERTPRLQIDCPHKRAFERHVVTYHEGLPPAVQRARSPPVIPAAKASGVRPGTHPGILRQQEWNNPGAGHLLLALRWPWNSTAASDSDPGTQPAHPLKPQDAEQKHRAVYYAGECHTEGRQDGQGVRGQV